MFLPWPLPLLCKGLQCVTNMVLRKIVKCCFENRLFYMMCTNYKVITFLIFLVLYTKCTIVIYKMWELQPQPVHDQNIHAFTTRNSSPNVTKWNGPFTDCIPDEIQRIKYTRQRIILLWTPFYEDYSWTLGKDFLNTVYGTGSPCRVTSDRSVLEQADAVVFHCRDNVDQWPAIRHPSQVYVLACSEPPTYASWSDFNYKINLTATYRTDSDIQVPYFTVFPDESASAVSNYQMHAPFSKKSRSVVWVSSNCQAPSQRLLYIQELRKHIDIDIFGKCGDKTCMPPQSETCKDLFEKNYKFYLSFENNVCKDYITEKLFTVLQRDIIPVVLGGANYTNLIPPKSYINVEDYTSPKHLAEYLKELGSDEAKYSEYFSWKTQYKVKMQGIGIVFCRLCHLLHEGNYHKESQDIVSWYTASTCDNGLVQRLLAGRSK